MDPAALTALVFLLLGVLFVLTELTVGSDGSLSILGVLSWIIAAWFAWKGWANPMGLELWAYLLGVVIGIPVLAGFALAALPHSPAGRNLFTVPDPEEINPTTIEEELWRESLIGKLATCLTPMNPGGLVLLDGERQHAESEGLPIEPGQTVQIVDVRSNRVIVRTYSDPASPSPSASPTEDLTD